VNRRQFIGLSVLFSGLASRIGAQTASRATAFVKDISDKLVSAFNDPGSTEDKRRILTQIIDLAVDVDGTARFCLGRFWRQASQAQQQRFVMLFRQLLFSDFTENPDEYQGIRLTVGPSRQQDENELVSILAERPASPASSFEWMISDSNGNPKIIDVYADGISLRLTQRVDYASYLTHNNNSIDALLNAMQNQVTQHDR
jgi:phospholipid transport system substrate-binding protein